MHYKSNIWYGLYFLHNAVIHKQYSPRKSPQIVVTYPILLSSQGLIISPPTTVQSGLSEFDPTGTAFLNRNPYQSLKTTHLIKPPILQE